MEFIPNADSGLKEILAEEKAARRVSMHSFHRYYGKLIPAIPGAFIKEFTEEGDLVFDPFTGSGTVAVEAQRHNRNFAGFEINPLSALIARAKTSKFSPAVLEAINSEIVELIEEDSKPVDETEIPFLMNRDHWFKKRVQEQLVIIKRSVDEYFEDCPEEIRAYKLFYTCVLSAIVKTVSNADERHVFPGVSKRMVALENEGKLNQDAFASFKRAIKSRAKAYDIYCGVTASSEVHLGDSSQEDMPIPESSVDLIVTNPPYISSVRYIETLKLELYWLCCIENAGEYNELAHKMLGNDKLLKGEYDSIPQSAVSEISDIVATLTEIDRKSGFIVAKYFDDMERVIANCSRILKPGKKLVMKISDSKMKKMKVETGRLLTLLAERNGFSLVDVFIDEINPKSRTLTTARNTYSDIITHDHIIVWQKNE